MVFLWVCRDAWKTTCACGGGECQLIGRAGGGGGVGALVGGPGHQLAPLVMDQRFNIEFLFQLLVTLGSDFRHVGDVGNDL